MQVSVIIPVYNEEKYIKKCIDSIKNQTYPHGIEIIVIDDGSKDSTLEILKKEDVVILRQEHKGAGTARNWGAKEAKGQILVFIDGDMFLQEDTIEKLVKPILDGKEAGTFIGIEKVANPENKISRLWSIAHNEPFDRKAFPIGADAEYYDVFRAIKKDVFINCGGNHVERAQGQDVIADRVGRKAFIVKDSVAFHYNPDTLERAYNDAKKYGKGRIHHVKNAAAVIKLLLKYSIFRSIPIGLYKSLKFKSPLFLFFKIMIDFAITSGFIIASFRKDTGE